MALEQSNKFLMPSRAAYKRSALSADQYAAATNALQVKQSGLWDGMIKTTGSLADQKKAMDDAAEGNARKQKDQALTLRLSWKNSPAMSESN